MAEPSTGVNPPTSEPVSIEREDNGAIRILWDDDHVSIWSPVQLRDACPCATCREKRRGDRSAKKPDEAVKKPTLGLPVLSAAEARPLTITGMQPVGRYAYQIGFSDGHRSGLFPLSLLHDGPNAAGAPAR